jgi:hypothetical protein
MRRRTAVLVVAASIIVGANIPAAADATYEWKCDKYKTAIRKAFPRKHWRQMDAICWRESKSEPRAIGWNYHAGKSHKDCKLTHAKKYRKCPAVKSYDVGLFQINSSWKTVTARICRAKFGNMLVLQRPSCNVKVAAYLYRNGGLTHWKGTSGK